MKSCGGYAIVELLTATVLLGIVTAACVVLMRAGAVVLRHTAERAAADEAVRTTQDVTRAELRALTSSDLPGSASDSISARIVRGFGIVCDTVRKSVLLRYRGLRLPDASKDSLLVLATERTGSFRSSSFASSRCTPRVGEQIVALQPDVPLRLGEPVLLFETGSYHLANNAFRYHSGNNSRQPLTDAVFDDRASHFSFDAQRRGVRILLRTQDGGTSALRESHFRLLNP